LAKKYCPICGEKELVKDGVDIIRVHCIGCGFDVMPCQAQNWWDASSESGATPTIGLVKMLVHENAQLWLRNHQLEVAANAKLN